MGTVRYACTMRPFTDNAQLQCMDSSVCLRVDECCIAHAHVLDKALHCCKAARQKLQYNMHATPRLMSTYPDITVERRWLSIWTHHAIIKLAILHVLEAARAAEKRDHDQGAELHDELAQPLCCRTAACTGQVVVWQLREASS